LETFELKVSHRTTTGKGAARSLRREGRIPAILYGLNTETISLAVSIRELQNIFKSSASENMILKLIIDNGKKTTQTAMVKELQTTPLTRDYLHVDFYAVSMENQIHVKVPVVVTGKSKGEEQGGLVQVIRNELEILCLPLDIPEAIEIDVTNLDIGDSVHVEDIPVREKVQLIADTNFTVVTILAPTVEEAVEEGVEEAAPEGEAAAPEESAEEAG
jgi:large subunit ribosomal protein L25